MDESSKANAEILTNLEQLIRLGNFDEALQVIDKFEMKPDLSPSDYLISKLLRGTILNKLGRFEDALSLSEQFLLDNQAVGEHIQVTDALIVKGSALWRLGRFDEGIEVLELGENILSKITPTESLEVARRQGSLSIRKGAIYQDKGELSLALECYEQSLTLFEKDDRKENIAEALNNIGTIYDDRGDSNKALEYYQRSLTLREEVGNKQDIAKCLNNVGIVHWMQGSFDPAIEYFEQSLELFKITGNRQNVALVYNNLGAILQTTGDLNRALDYYQESLVVFEEIGNKQHIAMIINNLGSVHHTIGNLEQALDYYEKGLALVEDIGNKSDIALALTNIGRITWQKGADFNFALECLEKSLSLLEEAGNNLEIAEALYSLIYVVNDRGFSEKARWYLERLLKINNIEDNKLIRQQYRVAQALVLKKSKRKRDTEKAKLLLRQVVEDEVLEHELFVQAMLNLCDSLLADLRASGEQKVLEDVRDLVSKLLEVVNEQRSHSILAETYLLQSKLALLKLDLQEARKLLTKAQSLADRNDMVRLAMKISREHDSLLEKLNQWERFIEKGASLKELADSAGLREMVIGMIQQRTMESFELAEEEPVLLSISHRPEGRIIFSRTLHPEKEIDEEITNKLQDAIKTAVEDFSSLSIDRARLGEYTLLIRSEEPVIVCYVFKGQSYSAQQKLTRFLRTMSSTLSVWENMADVVDKDGLLREIDKTLIEGFLTEIF
ncbi:MAG: tetratricopeptide repeat protein [Candidatus Thorarchaeota archaeon]